MHIVAMFVCDYTQLLSVKCNLTDISSKLVYEMIEKSSIEVVWLSQMGLIAIYRGTFRNIPPNMSASPIQK